METIIELTKDQIQNLQEGENIDLSPDIPFVFNHGDKLLIQKESENEEGIDCSECSSTDMDFNTGKEYQGEYPHGGYVSILLDYTCNKCGHKEEL